MRSICAHPLYVAVLIRTEPAVRAARNGWTPIHFLCDGFDADNQVKPITRYVHRVTPINAAGHSESSGFAKVDTPGS